MKTFQKYTVASSIALLITVISAAIASNMTASDSDLHPDWSAFGIAMWTIIIVTVPAACIFMATAVAGFVAFLRDNRRRQR